MSDFAQTGLICTLQRLSAGHEPLLEEELKQLSRSRPIVLILPCHGAELGQPALLHIRDELRSADWLSHVIVSLNALGSESWRCASEFFGDLPQPVRILWNDGPTYGPLVDLVRGAAPHGKGLNLWAAVGAARSLYSDALLLTQDCDVVSFRRENLARLAYAAAHPDLGFGFAKMYYSRATDRLYGRVTRLFLAPLLQAVVRFAGHQPLLDFLRSFRYPLAGEVAIDSALAAAVPFDSSWGVEIGLLTEIFRQIDPRNVAQVDGGGGYEHRHHPAAEGGTLSRMVRDISETLLVALQQEGCGGSEFNWHMIRDGYLREAQQAIRRSSALARINGFAFDEDAESGLVEIFGNDLLRERSVHHAPLPSWSSLKAQRPAWVESFGRAVNSEH